MLRMLKEESKKPHVGSAEQLSCPGLCAHVCVFACELPCRITLMNVNALPEPPGHPSALYGRRLHHWPAPTLLLFLSLPNKSGHSVYTDRHRHTHTHTHTHTLIKIHTHAHTHTGFLLLTTYTIRRI